MGGWLKVWVAYPILVSALAVGNCKGVIALCFGVIGLQIGFSVSIGIGLDRLARRIEKRGASNHTSDGI